MFEKEKNKIYLEVREKLLESCKNELNKLNRITAISTGVFVGDILSILFLGNTNSDLFYTFCLIMGCWALITNLVCMWQKNQIIAAAETGAKQTVDNIANLANNLKKVLPQSFGNGVNFRMWDSMEEPFKGVGFIPAGIGNNDLNEDESIKIDNEALDENGKKIKITGTGLLAQAISHEMDHLEGVVLTEVMIPGSMEIVNPEENKNKK